MLCSQIVEEIRRLLAAGKPQREIARLTGVGRGTVGAIASGKRPDYTPRESQNNTTVPPYRCLTCGARVNIDPCPACEARRYIARKGA